MGYTGTTNYGFQKPAKENAFTVDDLNHALDKIDETIKDESIKSVSLDTDENDNLILKIIKNNNQDYTDQVSLAAISGSLVVNETMATANMTITKTATSQQIYNGAVTSQTIPTGAGSFKVKITQFGSTIEKDVQVSGETLLDLSADVVTVTPKSSAISWSINNVSIPSVSAIKVIKGITKTVKLVFGNWNDGSEISYSVSQSFDSNVTINTSYSDPKIISTSGNFIVPKSAQYEIVLTGGGGGGSGGGAAATYGGNGGYGGYVYAVRTNLTINDSIPVTIGAGGAGGAGQVSGSTPSGSGSPGGTTIFGSYQAEGGAGAEVRNQGSNHGGAGGDGSNGKNMSIFGQSKSYGEGAGWGYSTTQSPSGTAGESGITWLNNVGKGGDGGRRGSNSNYGGYGGDGGYGFYYKTDYYGMGGWGGSGGYKTSNGDKGSPGTNGAVAIRMVV